MTERTERGDSATRVARLFSFPNPVNEVSARLVAAGVVLMSTATLAFDQLARNGSSTAATASGTASAATIAMRSLVK